MELLRRHPALLWVSVRIAKALLWIIKPLLRATRRAYNQYKKFLPDSHYNAWAVRNETVCFVEDPLKNKPLVSIVVPLYNTCEHHLLSMVYSVVNQHYDNWELVLVNASDQANFKNRARQCVDIDRRIKIVETERNEGIAENTNIGIKNAKGEFVAFMDHDDMLHPCALHSVAAELQQGETPDLIYSDEDKVTDDGERFFDPHCKPRWSPDLLRNVNYINHLSVVRNECLRKVGYLRTPYNGAQDYDLLLRVIDLPGIIIRHIPRILYHWRAASSSTAQNILNKKYIFTAGTKALEEHLKRNHLTATVKSIENRPGFYKVSYYPVSYSIVIGPVLSFKQATVAQWLKELSKRASDASEIIVGSWFEQFHRLGEIEQKIRYVDVSANYWEKAIKSATNDTVVCFKIAALPYWPDAINELAAIAAQRQNALVSPVITSNENFIVDAGFVDLLETPIRLFQGYEIGQSTYFGSTEWVRNVSHLTTNVIAAQRYILLPILMRINSYQSLTRLSEKVQSGIDFIVWTPSPFRYLGEMFGTSQDSSYNPTFSRISQHITVQTDNWRRSYERSAKI